MVSARDIRAGAAYVELTLRDNKLNRGLQGAQRRLQAFSASAGAMGRQMAALSAVMSAPFIAGVGVYAAFEQQLANVATMLERPGEHLPRFREGIRQMAVEFGESTQALAGGLYDILSASVPAEHALGVLAVAARAAKAGITDTATAADAITTVLNAYGMSADQAGSVSDALFAVVKRGKTTFSQLAPSIGRVASIASASGLSLDELGAAIATLTRNGVQTEQAMSAIGAVLATFLKPTDESARAARELGFEMSAATLQSEGLFGVAQRLAGLPPDALARIFPNVEALRGLLPLINGVAGFGDDVAALQGRAGSTETAFVIMNGTLLAGFKRLRQAALGVLDRLGQALAEPVSRAASAIRSFLPLLSTWTKQNEQLVRTVATIVVGVGAIGVGLITVAFAAKVTALAIGGLLAVFKVVSIAFTAAIGILVATKVVILALLSPIGLVASAFAAMGAIIINHSGFIGEALGVVGQWFNNLSETAVEAWGAIGTALAAGNIQAAAKVMWSGIHLEWKRGILLLEQLWATFKASFLQVGTDMWYGLVLAVNNVVFSIQEAWAGMTHYLQSIWAKTVNAIASSWSGLQDLVAKGVLHVMGAVDSSLDVEAAKGLIDQDAQARESRRNAGAKTDEEERTAARDERLAALAKDRENAEIAIGQAANQADDERRTRYAEELKGLEGEVAAAKEAFREAAAAARATGNTVMDGPELPTPTGSALDKLATAVAAGTSAAASALSTGLDVSTFFGGGRFERLSAGTTAADRTAAATEQTAKNTLDIARASREAALVFE